MPKSYSVILPHQCCSVLIIVIVLASVTVCPHFNRCTVPSPQVKHHHSDSDPPHTATTSGRHVSKPATLDKSLSDFGHSLMAGYSDTYLTDFVLHGTSQPLSAFKDAMISDLSSIVKVQCYTMVMYCY